MAAWVMLFPASGLRKHVRTKRTKRIKCCSCVDSSSAVSSPISSSLMDCASGKADQRWRGGHWWWCRRHRAGLQPRLRLKLLLNDAEFGDGLVTPLRVFDIMIRRYYSCEYLSKNH